ncbi:hypothetical protein BD779DRAFT_1596769, partial [Infundibulicybe gibba]
MPTTRSNTGGSTAPLSTTRSGLVRNPAPPKSSSGRKRLQSNADQPDEKRARKNNPTGPEGTRGRPNLHAPLRVMPASVRSPKGTSSVPHPPQT